MIDAVLASFFSKEKVMLPASNRIVAVNAAPVDPSGKFVLYWMTAFRRTHWNYALQRAHDWAARLGRPLVVLEALRLDHPWAGPRFHSFVADGLADQYENLSGRPGIFYYPFLEPRPGAGKGLVPALADLAAVVVTDDFPCFFLPRMVEAAGRRLRVRLEKVDSNGLLPLSAGDRAFPTAHGFRRFLQKKWSAGFEEFPRADPLDGPALPNWNGLPTEILDRWPPTDPKIPRHPGLFLDGAAFGTGVPAAGLKGGEKAAVKRLEHFLQHKLDKYDQDRNHPDDGAASGLSPYLHFGHLSAHQVFSRLALREGWFPEKTGSPARGARSGWWNMSGPAESFLDQFIVWRELGFNQCRWNPGYDRYESLPAWARNTLELHASDPRAFTYTLDEFEEARTHDPVWNAAQRELVRTGIMNNYLRMLWGKKILEWTPHPIAALEIMIELNNKYALDGRDPNSYTGIFWVLGRHDRAFGPERPILGKIRYMSSANTVKKLHLKNYLRDYAE
ncbi:MAG: deoxyribodipyrimidine photolyase [Pseudomonadota bacterium]